MENINYCWGYLLLYLNLIGSLAIVFICFSLLFNDSEISPYWDTYPKGKKQPVDDLNIENDYDNSYIYIIMWVELPVILISLLLSCSFCADEDECEYACGCGTLLEKMYCTTDDFKFETLCYCFCCIWTYICIIAIIRGIYESIFSCGKQLLRYISITLTFLLNVVVLALIVLHIKQNYFYPKIIAILSLSSILTLSNFFVLLIVNGYECFGCYNCKK